MKVLPVIDLSRGVAVHARGGDRAAYRPVQSVLAASSDPLELARAFRDRLGLADLDAIAGEEPQWEVYRALLREEVALMVDAGVRDRHLALGLKEWGVRAVVAALETLEVPERIPELVEALGPRSLVLGLDLREGSPLGDPRVWGYRDAASIAASAHAKGVSRFLVLELTRVGSEAGPPLAAARSVVARATGADVKVGGGVRGAADLRDLAAAGVRGALVATALHRGTFDRAAVEEAKGLRPSGPAGGPA
jgi:phosphoribosylformimino-5-aminoimidazole carboxamide ribotide isomerase